MIGSLHPSARLLRGFAIDFLTSHDASAPGWVMDPDYELVIGGFRLSGRDGEYLPATAAQLEQFPGLVVTVHDVILGPDHAAMRFTEHGVSTRQPGDGCAWGGVTLFRIENGRLRQGWAEEDYYARKRQLKSGRCDAIRPPHPAPWDVAVMPADPGTAATARHWLADPTALMRGVDEISAEGPTIAELLMPSSVTLNMLFSAGGRAAFHADIAGSYAGGFPDVALQRIGDPAVLRVAGMMDIVGGQVMRVQVAADRLGLSRALMGARE